MNSSMPEETHLSLKATLAELDRCLVALDRHGAVLAAAQLSQAIDTLRAELSTFRLDADRDASAELGTRQAT